MIEPDENNIKIQIDGDKVTDNNNPSRDWTFQQKFGNIERVSNKSI